VESAHAYSLPFPTVRLAMLGRPGTTVGASAEPVVVPLPRMPLELRPQQYTFPVVARAQLPKHPMPTSEKVTPDGLIGFGVGSIVPCVPIPRLQLLLSPQQKAWPSVRRPHPAHTSAEIFEYV